MSEQEIVAKRMTGGKEDDRTKKGGKEGDSFQIRSTNGDTINGPTTVSYDYIIGIGNRCSSTAIHRRC